MKNRILRALSPTGLRARVLVAVALAGVVTSGCDVHGVSAPGTVTSIIVTPNATVAAGSTQQMTAVGHDDAGIVVPFTPTWSVVASGGTISAAGVFTAGNTAGTYTNTIQASNSGLNGFATIIVTIGPLASLSVTPNPDTLIASAKQQFVVVGKDAGGNSIPVVATWSVVAGGGTIDGGGLFTAGATLGAFANTIKATSGSLSGTATVVVKAGSLAIITVTPNPALMVVNGTQQMTAVGTDIAGNVIPITPVWDVVTSSNGASITLSGLYTAGTVTGTFTNKIRASSGGISGFATVTVTAGALASITVSPNPATMPVNATQQFTAVAKDANGNVFSITPVWSVINGGGVISNTGMFTAGAVAGAFPNTVQATLGALTGTATVNVQAAAPPPPAGFLANGIMAGQSVTCVTGGVINADVSVSPGNTVTGFGPCVITGVQHLGDAVALANQTALTTAYNTLAGLPCPPANAIVANLGGTTKAAGVYCTASGIGVTGTLTLDGGGDPNAQFVFQAGTSLITAGNIVLINGAQAKNVSWQVGTSATLGTGSQWQGNILALTSITMVDNANLIGRALARNGSVTLGTNNVITLP